MRTEINRAIWSREIGPDDAAEIHRLKMRMKQERGRIKPDRINLKFSPGGLVDLEFAAQYMQLLEGADIKGGFRSPRTSEVWRAAAARGIGPRKAGQAAEAYELLGRVSSRLGLIYNRTGDRAGFTPEEIDRARIPGSEGSTLQMVRRAMETGVETYRQVFGMEANNAGH